MKIIKYLMVICALCAFTLVSITDAQAKKKPDGKVYMFGFSASFTDSLIYFTDIQVVDSAKIDPKTHFLQNRNIYAQQLQDYFSANMQANRVCIVMYALSQSEAEKKYLKMRRIYTKETNGRYDVRYLTLNEFRFNPIPTYF